MKRTRRGPTFEMHLDADGDLTPGPDPKQDSTGYAVTFEPGDFTVDMPTPDWTNSTDKPGSTDSMSDCECPEGPKFIRGDPRLCARCGHWVST